MPQPSQSEARCFGASADERLTRGFIHQIYLAVFPGFTKTARSSRPCPRRFRQYRQACVAHDLIPSCLRRRNRNRSPVCTPIGSKFSIEQMIMQFGLIAYHFISYFPTEHGLLNQQLMSRETHQTRVRHRQKPVFIVGNAAAPEPPIVKDERIRVGSQFCSCQGLFIVWQTKEISAGETDFSIASLSGRGLPPCRWRYPSRGSARHWYFASTPLRANPAQVQRGLSPIVGQIASGRSLAKSSTTTYRLDMVKSPFQWSVIIVWLEFTE